MKNVRRVVRGMTPLIALLLVSATSIGWLTSDLGAQGQPGHGVSGHPTATAPAPVTKTSTPRRVTMEELHRSGGVPRGWTFALPPGNPTRGRQVFVDLECFKCHVIRGETFPAAPGDGKPGDGKNAGPELTGMGPLHPAEYFAESVLAPNAVIVEGKGFTGSDGLSIMPGFGDSLTVPQLLDLVAYLKSLTGGAGHAHEDPGPAREQVVGDYRIRLVYRAGGHGHDGHGEHGTHASGHGSNVAGHLMAFVADRDTAEPVPYLSVTATVHASGRPARTLKLAPMVSGEGFHYGANVTLPERTTKITLAVGPTTMQVVGTAKGRFGKLVTASFDWALAPR